MSRLVEAPAIISRSVELSDYPRDAEHSIGRRAWPDIVFLSLLCGFLFFYGLNAGELYRTESLRAIVAEEMLRSGNWIVPTLYGEPLLTKPPGMYAAIALASLPFGRVQEWTARLPSALAATLAVFMFYGLFRRHLGRRAGLIAGAVLPTSFMWLDKATAAEIDMLQVAWVTGSIVCFLRALENVEEGRSGSVWWLAALLCVAGGVLTKWTAPAFFYGTVLPLLWWRGRLRLLWRRGHLIAVLSASLLCFAWIGSAVHLAGWDAFYDAFRREALLHLSPSHHPRPYPWRETLVHPLVVLVASLPCSAVALSTIRPRFAQLWDERGLRLLQALHCWTWPNLLFWSILPQHSVRHSFPLLPGIAGLSALVWIAWDIELLPWQWHRREQGTEDTEQGTGDRQVRLFPCPLSAVPCSLISVLVLWLIVKVCFVEAIVPARTRNRDARGKGEQIAALVPEKETLYVFRLKDEGLMFYYGRQVRRLRELEHLPSTSEPLYCILDEFEWRQWQVAPAFRRWSNTRVRVVLSLNDGQGDPIVLVKIMGAV